jgi:hypothetical protein
MLKPHHELQEYLSSSKNQIYKLEDKGSYLGISIPHHLIIPIRKKIEKRYNLELKHRNEAHITVITPPELKKLLSYYSKLDLLSKPYSFDDLKAVCIGQFTDTADPNKKTFFVVIQSDGLKKYRESIKELGQSVYHPHITIGFTETDIYPEQGAIKDDSSCISL